MAAVAVRTGVSGEDHAAELGLVARVSDDRAKLADSMCELAMLAVWALPCLLPLVAQFSLEHSLVINVEFHGFLGLSSVLLLRPAQAHFLLLPF